MKTATITTQAEVRASFWRDNPGLAASWSPRKRQNAYSATIRSAFVEYVDALQKSGEITEALADRVTL